MKDDDKGESESTKTWEKFDNFVVNSSDKWMGGGRVVCLFVCFLYFSTTHHFHEHERGAAAQIGRRVCASGCACVGSGG